MKDVLSTSFDVRHRKTLEDHAHTIGWGTPRAGGMFSDVTGVPFAFTSKGPSHWTGRTPIPTSTIEAVGRALGEMRPSPG